MQRIYCIICRLTRTFKCSKNTEDLKDVGGKIQCRDTGCLKKNKLNFLKSV